jgi:hypothetical protein
MAQGSRRQRAGHQLTSPWSQVIGCAAVIPRHSENSGLNMSDDQHHIRLSLKFLMYPEGGFWFGHCLDAEDYHLEHALPEPIERAEARELQLA